jgi:mono/diheme cytochrome c family protein
VRRPRAVALLALVAALAVAACGTTRRGEPLVGPLALAPDAAQGEPVFMQHCHQCHPKGEAGLGPSLNDKPLPGFLVRLQVRRGLGAMPAFPAEEISSEELDALITYMAALRRGV